MMEGYDQQDPFQDASAAEALDRIRDGGSYVVGLVIERLNDAIDLTKKGDFGGAVIRASEAHARLTSLNTAQKHLGDFDRDQKIIRAMDVETGMVLYQWGRVEAINYEEEAAGLDDVLVHIMLDTGEQKKVFGQAELVVVLEQDE